MSRMGGPNNNNNNNKNLGNPSAAPKVKHQQITQHLTKLFNKKAPGPDRINIKTLKIHN